MKSRYFHLTLGPVQGFVAQARRSRDFWAGSFILSWLSGVAMSAVRTQGGEIIFPKADENFLAWLGVTKEGLLYQAQYLRMSEEVKIGAIVSGIREDFQPTTKQRTRFGGEGRLASVEVTDHVLSPPKIQSRRGHNLLLMLLTPADLGCKKESWLPSPYFNKVKCPIIDDKECTVWEVNINGVELSIVSAVLGKTVQEGGWNLRQNSPRPLKSLVPLKASTSRPAIRWCYASP